MSGTRIAYIGIDLLYPALPALLSSIGLAAGDMMDAVVVGQSMGVTGLAAISLALPVFMVINVLMHGFGIGGSVRFATQLAQGKPQEAADGFQGILAVGLLTGAVLAVLGNVFLRPLLMLLGTTASDGLLFETSRTYVRIIVSGAPLFFFSYLLNYFLRNDDYEKIASLGFTVGNFSDIALNVVFVLWLNLGVAGAAWATLAGQVISIGFYLAALAGKTSPRQTDERVSGATEADEGRTTPGSEEKSKALQADPLRLFPFSPDFHGCFSCFRTGFSSSVSYLFSMLFILTANHLLMRMSGSVGVAVFDMVQNASFLILYLYDGTARAAQPLVSTYCGEHNQRGREHTLRLSLTAGTVAGAAGILLTAGFPGIVCGLFGLDGADAVWLGSYALRVFCVGAGVAGVSIILESYYQSGGEERAGFVLAGMEDIPYREGKLTLEPGDRIFLYTDGVPEATNMKNEMFGLERMQSTLNRNKELASEQLLPAVKAEVDRFVEEAPQFDDITMLCLEYRRPML